MSRAATEQWLAELQSRFSSILRQPLSAAGGTLHADSARYPARALEDFLGGPKLSAAERLGVYQRQYWMRLMRLLQEQYPLTMRLCGAWGFNLWAIEYIARTPPRGSDLSAVPEGFDAFLAGQGNTEVVQPAGAAALPRAALLQSAAWDSAFRRVWSAAEEPKYRPNAQAGTSLLERRFRLASDVARIEEHWPLLELRRTTSQSSTEDAVSLPAQHPRPKRWVLHRTTRGLAHFELRPNEAMLLDLLEQYPLGSALARLEAESEASALPDLPAATQGFLARAVERGLFRDVA